MEKATVKGKLYTVHALEIDPVERADLLELGWDGNRYRLEGPAKEVRAACRGADGEWRIMTSRTLSRLADVHEYTRGYLHAVAEFAAREKGLSLPFHFESYASLEALMLEFDEGNQPDVRIQNFHFRIGTKSLGGGSTPAATDQRRLAAQREILAYVNSLGAPAAGGGKLPGGDTPHE